MSLTDKLFMLPNEKIAMALGMKVEDINIKEKANFRKDFVWAIKTANNDLIY